MGYKTRIIIFSSNEKIAESFSKFVSKYYKIQNVSLWEELIHLFKEAEDNIVFIDSDIEICAKLKSFRDSESSVILLMPSGSETDFVEIEKSRIDAYIEYPFSQNVLLTTIRSILNEKKQRKNLKQITSVTKESEQKYKRLFQLSPDAMGYHVGGKIGFINDAGIKILGANSFEEVFGKYFLDFIHPFDKEFVFEKTRDMTKEKPIYLEARIVSLDGRTKYIDISSTPFTLGGVNAVQFIFRDITEKKTNELNLIETNSRIEFVQNMAKIGYWELDFRTNKLTLSKNIYEMWNLSSNNFQPSLENIIKLIHPEDRQIFQQALDAALSGAVALDIEHRIVKDNGHFVYVNQRGTVVNDEKGKIIKFSGSIQDITERKLMENVIRENQSRLSNIINSAMDAVVTVDSSQNIILFNITAEKMFKCSAEKVIGKSLTRFIPIRFQEIHKKHIETFGKTGITMRTMGTINPISGLRADGEEFPIEASISQVEVGGQKLYTVIIRDVTEKKKAEEALISSEARYRLLFQKNPLPMWVFDIDTLKFLAVNFAAVKVYGYTRDEFLSMTVLDIRPQEEIEIFKNYLKKVENQFHQFGIWKHKKKDGTIIDAEIVSHEIEFDGKLARISLANDVSEKKKAEDDLRNSREQLRELAAHLQNIREEERSAIAREIHDELGQVLTSLKMNLVFVDKKITNSGESVNIPDLHNEISGMTSIIDDSVKRIRKIITELRPEMLDQLGLISALEWQAKEFKIKSGIECDFINSIGDININRNISIAVFRIMQEALTNVIRHSKATKVDIQISRENNHLGIQISDNGIGYEMKKKSKTFGVLGMRERAIILGGDFKVESNNPSGTKIKVNIPLDIS